MNELNELLTLEEEVKDIPDLLRTVRNAIKDLTHPIGKENAIMAINEVRDALIEMEAPDTERSPQTQRSSGNFILPPASEQNDDYPLFI